MDILIKIICVSYSLQHLYIILFCPMSITGQIFLSGVVGNELNVRHLLKGEDLARRYIFRLLLLFPKNSKDKILQKIWYKFGKRLRVRTWKKKRLSKP